jgi:hypothetical protein
MWQQAAALRDFNPTFVRFGSQADMTPSVSDPRHRPTLAASRLSARTGREQSQQSSPLFDHLVGALLKKPRHVDLQCLRGFHIQNKFELRW